MPCHRLFYKMRIFYYKCVDKCDWWNLYICALCLRLLTIPSPSQETEDFEQRNLYEQLLPTQS